MDCPTKIVKLLIEYGADPNFADIITPLAWASRDGDIEYGKWLLSHGADPNKVKDVRFSALFQALMKSDIQFVDLLLESGADWRLDHGMYFVGAVRGGRHSLTRLLECEMSKEERRKYMNVALQAAASRGRLDICEWLLSIGANLQHIGGKHGSPLQAALAVESIFDDDERVEINNIRHLVEKFLALGARVNIPENEEKYPSTLQMTLAKPYFAPITNTILDAGADVNAGGGELHRPLQTAALSCHNSPHDFISTLLGRGADVNSVGGKCRCQNHCRELWKRHPSRSE